MRLDSPGVLDEEELAPELAETRGYGGAEAIGFGLREGSELAAVCWYWWGDRYRRRGFWPLADREAKMVQITTAKAFRGKGLATRLIAASAEVMGELGYSCLYARIWPSNYPSIRAFEKSGWRYHAFVAKLYPFGSRRGLRLAWHRGGIHRFMRHRGTGTS